ncbi:MAG TPA: plastocyanin/azurin family copper-binding protein [Gemmatimonadales bacterium]|nr:plastocyanin/azurin family copper-binding protein [Gemmatimonadales bacterium]
MWLTRVVGATGLVLLASCGSSTSSYGGGGGGGCTPTATQVCMVSNLSFSPASLTITHGTTVTWMNGDAIAHTATSSSSSAEAFNSGQLGGGGTFTHTFNTPGTFHYYCQNHGFDGNPPGGMAGTITVN